MTPRVRAAIAYVASRLISGAESSAIFDFFARGHRSMGGTVNETCVNIYDFSENCQLTGHSSNGSFQLFHHAERTHLSLKIVGTSFQGSDHSTGRQFRGSANGPRISIYDDAERRTYGYWCEAPRITRLVAEETGVGEDAVAAN